MKLFFSTVFYSLCAGGIFATKTYLFYGTTKSFCHLFLFTREHCYYSLLFFITKFYHIINNSFLFFNYNSIKNRNRIMIMNTKYIQSLNQSLIHSSINHSSNCYTYLTKLKEGNYAEMQIFIKQNRALS